MAAPVSARSFAKKLIDSQDYREWLEHRIRTKTLDKSIEALLWAYAAGKPTSEVHITNLPDLSGLNSQELLQQVKEMEVYLKDIAVSETDQ